jgi:dTDP-4-dehydrorhamnose 3,5-epimerase
MMPRSTRSGPLILRDTPLAGLFVIEPERFADERGFFARTYDRDVFVARGLDPVIAHADLSFNRRRGTLRGMHFQAEPFMETKLVRCSRGAIWDVVVDLRDGSPTRGSHFGLELTADNRTQLYVPKGFAHGFLTLADDTEIAYQISAPYSPSHARGYRWDSPAFALPWPEAPTVISARDRELPVWDGGESSALL